MSRLVMLLLLAAPAVAAPVPKAIKKPAVTFQGVWQVVERQNDAKRLPSDGYEFWVITDGEYTIFDGVKDVTAITDPTTKSYRGQWKHANDDPSTFDTHGKFDNIGRLELDGDTLRIGFDISDGKVKARPAAAQPRLGVAYIQFKRVDDPKLKAK